MTERTEIKSIALLLTSFYTCEIGNKPNWRATFSHLLHLLEESNESEEPDDVYLWITNIIKKIKSIFNEEKILSIDDERSSLPELVDCITELNKSTQVLSEDKLCLNGNVVIPFVPLTHSIFRKSMKVATEGKYYFLLHSLISTGMQSVDDTIVNDMLRTKPLHHAAAAGKLANVAYLLHTCHADPKVQDTNGNTPAHLASMNGHKTVASYILKHQTKHNDIKKSSEMTCDSINKTCSSKEEIFEVKVEDSTPNLGEIRNSNGMTSKLIKEAFSKYEEIYEMKVEDPRSENYMELIEQTDADKLTTKLLKKWLLATEGKSFKELVEKARVDYNKGEAKEILSLASDFAQKLGDTIAEKNSIFKGILKLVGSAGDRARIYAPDEYDFTWILEWFDVISEFIDLPENEKLYKRYDQKIKVYSDTPEIQHLLQKTNLLEKFYACAQEAVKEIIPTLDPRLTLILPGIKRIGCGICLTLAWYGKEYPLLVVNIDMVPSFKTPRPDNFPLPNLAKERNIGKELEAAYIVQTNIGEGENRTATTLLEQHWFLDDSLDCQIFIFILAKLMISKLKTEKWAPVLFKDRFKYFDSHNFKIPSTSGFILKSALFKNLEDVPKSEDWEDCHIVERLKGLFRAMCDEHTDGAGNRENIFPGHLPNYFSPKTQPKETGLMAPTILRFIEDNEVELKLKQQCPRLETIRC